MRHAMTLPITDTFSTRIPEIPGYRVVRRLGEGGMAEIYLAIQLSLQRQVALKVLAYEHSVSEELAERFEREARTIARLDHPHIVAIHEVGRTRGGLLYYTMPYLPNGDLAHRDLRTKPTEVARVVRSVAQALAYAHAQHVVHRDVKPENILFDKTDRPLLADFGIALTRDESHRVTNPGRTLGSSGYMSPEQSRGQELDGRADLYSVGVVAYEMLVGELPYAGADALAMAIAHMQDPLPRLPAAHRAWQPFLDRALAKSLNDRFQSAEELLQALDEVDRRLVPNPADADAHAPRRGVRGSLLAAFGVVAALAAIVVVGGLGPFAPRSADEAAPVASPSGPAVTAVTVSDMDEWLAQAYGALGENRLVAVDGNDAATPILKLLGVQPTNPEALQALDKLADALAKQAERALAANAGDRAAAAWDAAKQVRERGGAPAEPAWKAFGTRYRNALLAALERAAARGDATAAAPLAPALARVPDDARIATASTRLGQMRRAGESLRDASGPALVVVPKAVGGSTVANEFAIAVDEVTKSEYAAFARDTNRAAGKCRDVGALALLRKRDWREPGFAQANDEPVVCVTVDDARAYAQWLSRRTGQRYRLPTRAEWKHVAASVGGGDTCRLGNVLDASTAGGIDVVDRHGCDDGRSHTAAVGRYAASALGVHDLVGNVAEWTSDCAPSGCTVAGSSWRDGAKTALLPQRERDATLGAPWIGFRVVRELEPTTPVAAAAQ